MATVQENDSAEDAALEIAAAVRAAREQHRAGGDAVLDVLLRMPGIRRAEFARDLEHHAGVAALAETENAVPDFSRIDLATARDWRCVALQQVVPGGAKRWLIAAEDPWDEAAIQRAARRLAVSALPAAATRAVMAELLGVAKATSDSAPVAAPAPDAKGPIVGFVDQALRSAYESGASDVHFECDRRGISVRHRTDGVLVPYARLEGVQQAQEVISRIKVLAQLDITERRLPQDGRCRLDVGSASVDLRVSIMPSVHGEDAVLRLLDKARLRAATEKLSLDRLGFAGAALDSIRHLVSLPSGMLLATGPTGSGKTTTIYAALMEVNSGTDKIVTIEDPVEYELSGVLQIPVNDRKGLTFAKGLRSILRHDPDRILVGEIRDAETAEIAVQSALTGHQVMTTVHANGMADVVGRFRHFGLDMFGLMSSLNGVLVQRLLREVCPHCVGYRKASALEATWLAKLGLEPSGDLPVAMGCVHCRHTGYHGRFVVAEVNVVDDALRDQVCAGAPLVTLKAHAAMAGVEPLASCAARCVFGGRTTMEELRRVVGW